MRRYTMFFVIFLVALMGMISIGCRGGILLRLDAASTIKHKLGLRGPNDIRLVIKGLDIYPLDVIVLKEYDRTFVVIAPNIPEHVPYKVAYAYAGRQYEYTVKTTKWSGGQWRVGYGELRYPGNRYEGPLLVTVYYYRDDTRLGKYGELERNTTYITYPLASAQYTVYFPHHSKW